MAAEGLPELGGTGGSAAGFGKATVGSNAGRFRDRSNNIPAAGALVGDPQQNVEMCVKHDDGGRPPTPPDIAHWRKGKLQEVGRAGIHPGKARDEPPPDIRFGHKNRYDDKALDLIQADKSGFFLGRQLGLKEQLYASNKREPLGKSMVRGHKLPVKTQTDAFKFGVPTAASESAKGVIYPPQLADDDEEKANHDKYCRTHNAYDAGEQKSRSYNWEAHKVDKKEFRFGFIEKNPQREGVKQALGYCGDEQTVIVRRTLEDFKDTAHDHLGTVKNQGFGEQRSEVKGNFTFGKANKYDDWGAHACMRGGYSAEEQQPDTDLGKAVRPGFRNTPGGADKERTFGVPTIRTDIPRPRSKKVTDNSNYGDDCNAFSLLCPSQFALGNVHEEDFLVPVSRDEMQGVAVRAGFDLTPEEFSQAWNLASGFTSDGSVSIETFRRAVDELGF